MKTLMDLKFTQMIKQKYDFSCGAAALASLLTYHYGRAVSEDEVLKAMYEEGDQEKIKKVGFSLLDMKQYLASLGMAAEGYRTPLDKLSKVKIPAMALINNKGYMHFVVIKGLLGDRVLLGDPSSGTRTVDREEFEKSWNGILFVINSDMDIGRRSFNVAQEWKGHHPSADSTPIGPSLNNFTIDSSITPNYF